LAAGGYVVRAGNDGSAVLRIDIDFTLHSVLKIVIPVNPKAVGIIITVGIANIDALVARRLSP
jgi:hypothetical protein